MASVRMLLEHGADPSVAIGPVRCVVVSFPLKSNVLGMTSSIRGCAVYVEWRDSHRLLQD